MSALIPFFFRGAAAALDYSVLLPPATITAGVPAPVQINMSASSCNASFPGSQGCDWPFLRPWLVGDPGYDGGIFFEQYLCKNALFPPNPADLSTYMLT